MWLQGLLEAIYPTRCAGCDLPGSLLCLGCQTAIEVMMPPDTCCRCGAPHGALTCTECWETQFAFTQAACVGSLARPLSRIVTMYKDGGEVRLARIAAGLLAENLREWHTWPQAIVAIPASRKAVARRGFDHVELIAQRISDAWGVPLLRPLESSALKDQRLLGRSARKTNTAEAIRVSSDVQLPERILLLDDVITTGATVDAAASALIAAGAGEVRVGALARAW